jgi:hypothetical protein
VAASALGIREEALTILRREGHILPQPSLTRLVSDGSTDASGEVVPEVAGRMVEGPELRRSGPSGKRRTRRRLIEDAARAGSWRVACDDRARGGSPSPNYACRFAGSLSTAEPADSCGDDAGEHLPFDVWVAGITHLPSPPSGPARRAVTAHGVETRACRANGTERRSERVLADHWGEGLARTNGSIDRAWLHRRPHPLRSFDRVANIWAFRHRVKGATQSCLSILGGPDPSICDRPG